MDKSKMSDGLYEQLISTDLEDRLSQVETECKYTELVDETEAPTILSEYISEIVKNGLSILNDNGAGIDGQIALANKIITLVEKQVSSSEELTISNPAMQLKALLCSPEAKIVRRSAKDLPRPETPISTSSLFTGAVREPNMASELIKEIESCDQVDMIVSFIRWSGVVLILDSLRKFTDSGKRLRIISTSYMGATELRAIVELAKLTNTEIRISYDSERTRLHAKAYIFKRNTGYSTAYVGSSNLTSPAMTSGCEWNIKITKTDLPDLFEKVEGSFEGYWNSRDFEPYTSEQYDVLKEALERQSKKENFQSKKYLFFDLYPYPYQQAILDKLTADREIRSSYKNLVVAATGTGKTMIAAFDYKRQCEKAQRRLSLLFVAHRREILEQSIECFRAVLKDPEFGELFVGQYYPTQLKHVFVSIEMLNQRGLVHSLPSDYYEYIILDECHHLAAKSYQSFLEYFKPNILLGLTATPERMDGGNILPYFNDRIAAEIRLPEAINRKLLCPFQYFCVADEADLQGLKWTRGGYDRSELEKLYVFSREVARKRARLIANSLIKYVADLEQVKGLVFCVSVEHAKFMSEFFNDTGIASEYLTGSATDQDRYAVKRNLQSGKTKLVCVVDLYNEGVDIKQINTILFLRPTESLTVFLQQLGRGLRISEGKDCLTVLDFIGQANKKYSFEAKFAALLQNHNPGVKREVENGFAHLPRGCYIRLEKKAKEYILSNIRNSLSTRAALLGKIQSFESDTGQRLSYSAFLKYYNMTPRAIYGQKVTFSECLNEAKLTPKDTEMWKKLYRLSSIDSSDFLSYMAENILKIERFVNIQLSQDEIDYWCMLYSCFINEEPASLEDVIYKMSMYFKDNSAYLNEIIDLLQYSIDQIDLISKPEQLPYQNVLRVHCTYTRSQALATFHYWKTSSEGVTRIKNKSTTCLFITLNKSNSYYSPTTAYHDYSISNTLFHWQSQNATSENTSVGQRYIHHVELGETILLFVREAKEDKYGSIPFTFLGKGTYIEHTGNKPMNIVWKLDYPIPAKFIEVTDKLGVS